MIDANEIKSFLEGNDPEEFIVACEFDYASDSVYKIKEIPGKGKEIILSNGDKVWFYSSGDCYYITKDEKAVTAGEIVPSGTTDFKLVFEDGDSYDSVTEKWTEKAPQTPKPTPMRRPSSPDILNSFDRPRIPKIVNVTTNKLCIGLSFFCNL